MLIDSHAHLDMNRFKKDRVDVIARARATGVRCLIDPGCDIASSTNACELARDYPDFIYPAVGVHPHEVLSWDADVSAALRALAMQAGVVAIGECGLDYYRMLTPRDLQLQALRFQIELALELDLPIILHVRDAFADMLALLQEYPETLRGVFHCFTGTIQDAEQCLALPGFSLSFSGLLTRPETGLHDVACSLPLDRILIETDSPYLLPVSVPAKRNEPQFVSYVARALADVYGLSYEEIGRRTSQNAITLFHLPISPQ